MTYVLLLASYLLGATPTSYWVGRAFHGIDLREHGSGNLGATNAFRVLGWPWALPVIVVDVAKGFIPVWAFSSLAGGGLPWTLAFGTAAVLGHMFSVWVGFRGGKGVATSAGVFLGLAPWAVLGAFLLWVGVTAATRYVSLGSVLAAAVLPVLVTFTPNVGGRGLSIFTTAMAVVVIWAHRANLARLLAGTETRIGASAAGPPEGAASHGSHGPGTNG